ncbi:MAG: signal peptidase I [Chloroflexota bacterium]
MIRRLANLLVLGGLLLLLAGWALVLRPASLGGTTTYVVVRGSSMLPTYGTGDLVVVQAATVYSEHDIVAYRVPAGELGAGRIVVHRIVGGDAARGFLMQGDNNASVDPWTPRATDVVGKAWIIAPGLGRVIAYLHQPVIAGGLAGALMVTVMLARPPRRAGRTSPAGN